jgi:predicted deacylase
MFKFNGQEVECGSRSYIPLKVCHMLDGNSLNIPVHVLHGKKRGPVMGLFAVIHGTEYYQNRIMHSVVHEIDLNELNGTLLVVPVANPPSFISMTRTTPNPPEETVDFSNLNRVFPGKRLTPLFGSMESTDVSLTMKMAATITDEILPYCNYIIDFHGQMRGMSLNKMLFNLDPTSKEMARAFGIGILHDPPGSIGTGGYGPMTDYAGKNGVKCIVPELGGGGHGEAFDAECNRIAIRGIRNVLMSLKMLEGEAIIPERQFYFVKAPHVRATSGGYMISSMEASHVGIGRAPREVHKSEVLATIYDPFSLRELEQIKSPCEGLLYACRVSGLVEAQSEVCAVADYDGSKWIS